MKKGYTLVELLATISILIVLTLIATPIVINTVKGAKEKAYESQVKRIIDAAKKYTSMNIETAEGIVDISTLRSNGLIADELLLDPRDNSSLEDTCVGILYNEDTMSFEYNYTDKCYLTASIYTSNDTSWREIISLVKANKYNNTSSSDLIGLEREVLVAAHTNDCWQLDWGACQERDELAKSFTTRIVNVTPCTSELESKSACGFVLEFVDTIDEYIMGTNDANGGYPAKELRTYLNNTIYNSLPEELRNGIINTKIVSSHSYDTTENFISNDKLYLWEVVELFGSSADTNSSVLSLTRQPDYYSNVTLSSNFNKSYKYNVYGNIACYWTRTLYSGNPYFMLVYDGGTNYNDTWFNGTLAPVFRLN